MLNKYQMIEMYKQGYSLSYIVDNYETEISRSQLYREIRKLGLNRNISDSHIQYKIDDEYFSKIDTQNKAYWLGFMFADGCVWKSKNGKGVNAFSIRLNIKDYNHLIKFKKCLKTDIEVYTNKKTTTYGIVEECGIGVSNLKMVNDLIKYGCIPRKSLTLKFPNLEYEQAISHFIRGYFDGDGCLTYNNKSHTIFNAKICGTYEFLFSMSKYLEIDEKYILKDKRFEDTKNIYCLNITKQSDLKHFLDTIYKNAIIKLDRKYERYLEYKQKSVI